LTLIFVEFDFFNYDFSKLNSYFISEHSPVFVYQAENSWKVPSPESIITVNCCLKDFSFFKQKEPTIAFQEIYMYLAGVLGNKENPTIQIDDKVKLQQHGFDNYSFKKLPQEKKRRTNEKK